MAGMKILERFVVRWRFRKTRPDEMDLDEGDVVLVAAKFNDGWCKGIRLRGYKVGYFPEDFVDKDPLDDSDGSSILPEKLAAAFGDGGAHSPQLMAEEQKELDKDEKRTKAAEEILSTELSYWNGLNLIVEHFIQPLKIYGVLSLEEIDVIFSNVETILLVRGEALVGKRLIRTAKRIAKRIRITMAEISNEFLVNFLNNRSLAGISKELIAKLQARLDKWDVKETVIGDILVEMFYYLKMFKPYFDSRSAANRLRIQYEKSNERYKNFVSRVNCGHTLDSLLLMPIQRIPRYELLLKELVKRTEPDHPDYGNLSEALAKAKETAADLNEHIRQIENESKIFEIIKRFPNDDLDLIISNNSKCSPRMRKNDSPSLPRKTRQHLDVEDGVRRSLSLTDLDKSSHDDDMHHAPSDPSLHPSMIRTSRKNSSESHVLFRTRMFIHEGPVQKVMFKNTNNTTSNDAFGELSDRYLILFSDIAIIAVEAGNLITGNKLKLKERINLSQCWTTEAESLLKKEVPKEMFVLGTPRKTYILQAPTFKEKTTWEKLLKQRISDEKQKFLCFWRDKMVPDEIFFKTTARAKVEYRSMNKNELDLRFNEEISVVGFRSNGLWVPGLYDPDNRCYRFIKDWYPGVNKMGKFGWFPAECITGAFVDNKEKSNDQFQPLSVATALQIKQKMLELTGSEIELKFVTSVKIFRADGTFRTCKLTEATTTGDIVNHLDKHNRMTGLNIEKDRIELWEESKDGTLRRKHKQNEKILKLMSFWGEYQSGISFVTRTRGMKESVDALIDTGIESTMERRQSRGGASLGRRFTETQAKRSESLVKSASFSGGYL